MTLQTAQMAQTAATVVGLALFFAWETLHPFFDRHDDRLRHGGRNLLIGGINAGLIGLAFVAGWVAVTRWSTAHGFGLMNLTPLPTWAHALGAGLLLDLWTYTWHRLNHRLPILWRFHRAHHSDTEMDVTTASRFHLGEITLSSSLRLIVLPLVGATVIELVVYETLLFAVVQFHHANIQLPGWLDRTLRLLIVTPDMHKLHHSRVRHEADSNYASLLTIWDRLFGSFFMRGELDTIRFGVDGLTEPKWQHLGGVIQTPFIDPETQP